MILYNHHHGMHDDDIGGCIYVATDAEILRTARPLANEEAAVDSLLLFEIGRSHINIGDRKEALALARCVLDSAMGVQQIAWAEFDVDK